MADRWKKILIDADCPEEVRVAVVERICGRNVLVEYDRELRGRMHRKGDVYVATVKKIEPALQAVFIDYGCDKHGFLPFSEISLRYYDIPDSAKEAILENYFSAGTREDVSGSDSFCDYPSYMVCGSKRMHPIDDVDHKKPNNAGCYGGFVRRQARFAPHRRYKLQQVIAINQKIMVQLTKEERGNKGASFSSYITLFGRYCVFMPDSFLVRSGVSKKIENLEERDRLKDILDSFGLASGHSVVIRGAAEGQNSDDVCRDFSYLNELWNNVAKCSEKAVKPTLLYADISIVKRAVRDMYDSKTKEIVISGRQAQSEALEYAELLFGKHAGKLISWHKGVSQIFAHHKIEDQVKGLYQNWAQLSSGGYIVITPTEALVAIDVNSGKMTCGDNVEETAYKANIEAAKEIARQINLRGLSGLIVIDFIDMVKHKYCRAVENELRDAFRDDKARVQFGAIGQFGLMEISRQRIKPSIIEIDTVVCQQCGGSGRSRSTEVVSVAVMRELRSYLRKRKQSAGRICVKTFKDVIFYMFNNMRKSIDALEQEFGCVVNFAQSDALGVDDFEIKYSELSSREEVGVTLTYSQFCNDSLRKKDFEGDSLLPKYGKRIKPKFLVEDESFWIPFWLERMMR